MCIIAYKPAGKAMFSADLVKNMFENNPDGAGFMYAKDGKVHYAKGYMSLDDLNKALDVLKKKVDLDSVPLVMHFRISTQGGVDKSLCHPFPVCSSYASMRKLKGTCDCAIAHNGIISYASTYASYNGGYYRSGNYVVHAETKEPDYNDTMTYIKKYFYPVSKGKSGWYMDKDLVSFFSTGHMLGGNRFAILSGDGHLEWLGSKVRHDGYIFSNSSYEKREPVLEAIPNKAGTNSGGTHYPLAGDPYFDDDGYFSEESEGEGDDYGGFRGLSDYGTFYGYGHRHD